MYQYLNDSQKRRLFNAVFVALIILSAFLIALTLNALKKNSYIGRGEYPANVISINGKGEVMALRDTGSFSFSIVEEGKTVKEAQDKASLKVNKILDAVKDMEVLEKDIRNDSYSFYPKYEYGVQPLCTPTYCPPSKQKLVGYEVNQSISVKVKKTADAGLILTKVGELGATNVSGLNFEVDDMDKVNAEARDLAVKDAKEKAEVLAKSLGVRLRKIVNFQESGSYPPVAYGGVMMKAEAIMADASLAPQIPMGEDKVISNITITYEVE